MSIVAMLRTSLRIPGRFRARGNQEVRCRDGHIYGDSIGTGLSFFYFAPTISLVAVPVASTDVPFIFREVTSDYQDVTIQGQVVFSVADPVGLSRMLNFTMDATHQKYVSDDPVTFSQRIINQVQVLIRDELRTLPLRTF